MIWPVRAIATRTCRHRWPGLAGIGVKTGRYDVRPSLLRHGRAWPGHPRLAVPNVGKSWMAGIKPAMTQWARPCHRPAILTRISHTHDDDYTTVSMCVALSN